jgi:hypothetical protein
MPAVLIAMGFFALGAVAEKVIQDIIFPPKQNPLLSIILIVVLLQMFKDK